ncbi:hypothetical protein ACFFGH_01660 [Lysobacter korlensis]|uniref:Lipoprotein n=1 Tax=Lysobacter korlensis TaxID=553636 RepID=A0ABV6RJK4_9GAMM
MTRTLARASMLSCAIALAGCSSDAAQPEDTKPGAAPTEAAARDDARTERTVPVSVELLLEELEDGRNAPQQNYRLTESRCREAGWPVRSLSGEQIARLGTATLELSLDSNRRLARETRWSWTSPGKQLEDLCLFEFREQVVENYIDRQVTGHSGDEFTPGWQQEPVTADEFELLPIDAAQAAEGHAIAAQAGWQDQGAMSVAGQPCNRWSKDGVSVCMWAEGARMGLSTDPVVHSASTMPDNSPSGIVLAQEPANGNGTRVTTRRFTAGESLPPSAFVPVTRSRGGQ